MQKKIKQLLLLMITMTVGNAFSHTPTNFYRPYDVDFRLYEWPNNKARIGAFIESGKTSKSRNWDSNRTGLLQMYNDKESSLAMLLGAPQGSYVNGLAQSLGVSAATATQDSYRGRFQLSGSYEEFDCTLFTRYKLPLSLDGIFELGIFVPFKQTRFHNVTWCDQTKDVLAADLAFKEHVSGKLAEFVHKHGCGLNLNCGTYKTSGLGDIAVILAWQKDFAQQKQYLKNVRVNASVGVSIPTGKKKNVDHALSLPLGNDGAWGIPARLGLDLDFVHNLRAGIDVSVLGLFDTTGTYRMKTNLNQTDFLLLTKAEASKSQGPAWQFLLFAQAKRLMHGVSATVFYQFLKNDECRLSPKSYLFNNAIVNSAQSLKEWQSHNFIFRLSYAPRGINGKRRFKPQLSLFYKLPITGKRAITSHTFGGQLAFNF